MEIPSELKEVQHQKGKKLSHALFRIAGFFVGAGLIAWFVSQSNLTGIADQLGKINFRFFYLIVVTFTAYTMVSVAWYLSFYEKPKGTSIWDLFVIRLIGESLAQINPTNIIAGETLKAVLLRRRGVSYKTGIVSLTISRFIIMISAVSLILIGIYIFFDSLNLGGKSYTVIGIVVIISFLMAILIALLNSGKGIFVIFRKMFAFLGNRIKLLEKLKTTAAYIGEVDRELVHFYRKKRGSFLLAFVLSFLHWVAGGVEFYIILKLLNLEVPLIACIGMEVGVMVFKAMGAFIPGQIGVEEYANKLMLELVNVSVGGIWITVSILRRARQLFWILAGFIAFFIIIRIKRELRDGNIVYNA